jgi:hypothetical protein
MKKGPLSNKDKEFIDCNVGMAIEELSKKLERSIEVLEKYLSSNKTKPKGDNIKLFARNKDRGVVIMTESASMASDENKNKVNLYKTRKYKDSIHTIKED